MGDGGLGPVDGEWSDVSPQTTPHPRPRGVTAETRQLQEACGEELGAGEAGFLGTSPGGHHGHCGPRLCLGKSWASPRVGGLTFAGLLLLVQVRGPASSGSGGSQGPL